MLLQEVRAQSLANSPAALVQAHIGRSALGRCAEMIRRYFCNGPDAVLLREDVRAKIYLAFASLASRGPARTLERYRQWVQKLATREYADELVILAVALELQIRIICVPYTATTALAPWHIATYDPAQLGQDGHQKTILLGNNDVHFMYLSPLATQGFSVA